MRAFGFVFIILFIYGCKGDSGETTEDVVTQDLSFLALGDSYTIGEGVEPAERWPVQLADSLRKRGVPVDHPVIIARTGWTTGDLLAAMDEQLEDEEYDLVSLLIGVNNQYQGKSIEEYEEELHELFSRAISHSRRGPEGVFAVSIPDYGATPFGASKADEIAEEIAEFNRVFNEVASDYGVEFYNITPISKRAAGDESLLAEDELHPSGKMYSLWVQEFIEEVISQLP